MVSIRRRCYVDHQMATAARVVQYKLYRMYKAGLQATSTWRTKGLRPTGGPRVANQGWGQSDGPRVRIRVADLVTESKSVSVYSVRGWFIVCLRLK